MKKEAIFGGFLDQLTFVYEYIHNNTWAIFNYISLEPDILAFIADRKQSSCWCL